MAKKVVLDDECCIGCGSCAELCPEVFEMGDDDKAKVIKAEGGPEADIKEAMEACPEECITWG